MTELLELLVLFVRKFSFVKSIFRLERNRPTFLNVCGFFEEGFQTLSSVH